MTIENHLIRKTYYETLMNKESNIHPVELLGELYMAEQLKDVPDLSYIRYAQGEIYFHNKDFETAIFKWENITNELEPWAKKNMADSYFELDLLTAAEEIYRSVNTDNLTLKIEVSLQLFLLYIEQGRKDMAVQVIKEAISLNPDYANVTNLARTFFEENEHWDHAIELAINESTRMESLEWFHILKTYVERELPKDRSPHYFTNALNILYHLDQIRFKQLVIALWGMYKKSNLLWIQTLNQLMANLELNALDSWEELTDLYGESYAELTNGGHLINELMDIIPNTLEIWLKLSNTTNCVLPSSAVLAWDETFPSSLSSSLVLDAKSRFSQSKNGINDIDELVKLFDTINEWTKKHNIEVEGKFKWIAKELLESTNPYLLIASVSDANKRPFVNALLRKEIGSNSIPTVVRFKHDELRSIDIVADNGIAAIPDLTSFAEIEKEINPLETIIDYKVPSEFLQESQFTLLDTPGLNKSSAMFNFLYLADSLLFILDTEEPFNGADRDILLQIKKASPNTKIDFLIYDYNNQNRSSVISDIASKIHVYFPNGKIFSIQSGEDKNRQLKELMKNIHEENDIDKGRINKLLLHLQKRIKTLTDNRVRKEGELLESINWNQDMTAKLKGAVNQLGDLEKEKAEYIKKSFNEIQEEIKKDIIETIPTLLKGCSDIINESSDLGTIHVDLNKEMNRRTQEYLNNTVSPRFYKMIENWIDLSEGEFINGKLFLNEMVDGFNALYGKERIMFACDFKILDDWKRDADRLTSRMTLDNVNILMRFNPARFLLKSAGKLLSAIPHKNMLYTKYKNFVENESYHEEAETIAKRFLEPFELFEKGLERDVTLFFKNPLNILKDTIDETSVEIQESEETLNNLRTNPETFLDPLTLFGLRLKQFEQIINEGKIMYHIS